MTDFVGETSDMPTPPPATTSTRPASTTGPSASATSPFQAAGLGGAAPDPSVWSEEQQQQFMNALLGAAASGRLPMGGEGAGGNPDQQPRRRVASSGSICSVHEGSVRAWLRATCLAFRFDVAA